MNVHLLRSNELKNETYFNVIQLLQNFQGPINFIPCENDFQEDDQTEVIEKTWNDLKSFNLLSKIKISLSYCSEKDDLLKFPYVEKVKTWKKLFKECENYRALNDIKDNEIVVLLTDIGNESNWFGGMSPNMKNYFVQTSNWEHFFGNSIDIRFPIAYEVISWIIRYFIFENNQAVLEGIHHQPIGCIMDNCEDKSQIIIKMRTADICDDCLNKIVEQNISKLYVRHLFEILDGIRQSMTFRGRSAILSQPSKIEIKRYTGKIFFTDLGGLELRLNPKEKSLYLLYLKYPVGIHITDLQDYRDELIQLYRRFTNQSEEKIINAAIDLLISPFDNDINVVISRINNKIKVAVGEYLQNFYCISGQRGERKKIILDRKLITNDFN